MRIAIFLFGLALAGESMAGNYRQIEYCEDGQILRCTVGPYFHECMYTEKRCETENRHASVNSSFVVKKTKSYQFRWDVNMCTYARAEADREANYDCRENGSAAAVLKEVVLEYCSLAQTVHEHFEGRYECTP